MTDLDICLSFFPEEIHGPVMFPFRLLLKRHVKIDVRCDARHVLSFPPFFFARRARPAKYVIKNK